MAVLLFKLFQLIMYGINIYSILLVIYILMSWVPASRETKVGIWIGKLAEPYLGFFRKFIPPFGMIDFSPLVALFALNLIGKGLAQVFMMIINSLL
ncbi:membrane protein [Sporosarcina sp. NCCP-2222]|uniref:YggT family protein n=1 Tax=Sporosarcina sp. NCCP-2222 TaxID=2935073 RepID=UPI0020865443|nr:YggT family protein [Sporosarcina sp. NCCP-2222]GKV55663.1 membrane protein [Sporosarcina sp. NCCP-2222]